MVLFMWNSVRVLSLLFVFVGENINKRICEIIANMFKLKATNIYYTNEKHVLISHAMFADDNTLEI